MKRTVLVTGASRGIGKAIAVFAGRRGYNVVVNYLDSEDGALETVKQIVSYKGSAIPFRADVSDYAQVDKMYNAAIKNYGRVDILVNNAGISETGTFQTMGIETMRRVFDVNFWGAVNCSHRFMRDMISAKWGRIINVSSIWGKSGASCEAVYSASKSALIGLSQSLAKELALSNITVNAILPGVINTDMNARLSLEEKRALVNEIPAGRMGAPNEIAHTAIHLMSDDSGYINGQAIAIDGAFI